MFALFSPSTPARTIVDSAVSCALPGIQEHRRASEAVPHLHWVRASLWAAVHRSEGSRFPASAPWVSHGLVPSRANGNAGLAADPGTRLDPQAAAGALGHLWGSAVPARCETACLRSDPSLPAVQVTVRPHTDLEPQLLKTCGAQSEIYPPGAASCNSFTISSMM